jgi:cytidylate kinase
MRRQTFLSRHPGYKDRAARRDAEWTEKARQDGQRELQDRIDETKHMDKNRVYYYEGCMG